MSLSFRDNAFDKYEETEKQYFEITNKAENMLSNYKKYKYKDINNTISELSEIQSLLHSSGVGGNEYRIKRLGVLMRELRNRTPPSRLQTITRTIRTSMRNTLRNKSGGKKSKRTKKHYKKINKSK